MYQVWLQRDILADQIKNSNANHDTEKIKEESLHPPLKMRTNQRLHQTKNADQETCYPNIQI